MNGNVVRSCFVLDFKVRIASSSDNMFRTFPIILLIRWINNNNILSMLCLSFHLILLDH